jgi:hypothetical protein
MMSFKDGVGGVSNSYSSFMPSRANEEIAIVIIGCRDLLEIFAERIRIQNLRFAHFLCAAQEMSGVIKR